VTTEAICELEKEVAALERRIQEVEERLHAIAADLVGAEAERDSLTRELAGYGTGTRAQLEELIKERADQEKAYEAARAELFRIAEMDLPLALSGRALRDRVADRLARERRREQWLAAAADGESVWNVLFKSSTPISARSYRRCCRRKTKPCERP
jgi:DNA sulfur modification protein DndD